MRNPCRVGSLWFLLVSLPMVAFAGGSETRMLKDSLGEILELQIDGLELFKTQAQDPACEDFALSENEVRFFVDNAIIVSGQVLEVAYDWYPCWMKGTIRTSLNRYEWTINPAGKGIFEPTSPSGSEVEMDTIYSVCDSGCREVFPLGGEIQHD